MSKIGEEKRKVRDVMVVLVVTLILIVMGIVFVYSASSVYALEECGSADYFLKKHLIRLGIGFLAFCGVLALPMDLLRRYSPHCLWLVFFATAATLLPGCGLKMHGAYRWLRIAGLSIQPSEFLKFFLFMYLGVFLEKRRSYLYSFSATYLPCLVLIGLLSLILLKQPDFGTVVILFSTWFLVFFIVAFDQRHLLYLLACSIPLFVVVLISRAYRMQRIMIFLNPWLDPRGKGFQLIQSLIAIGSGGLWGLGVGFSRQKFFYLPMQHTDFIFSIIAEEIGFVGVMLLVLCYFLLFMYGIRVAFAAEDFFAWYAAISFVFLLNIQALMNMMMSIGLLPPKGIGLPLVSYGGTSLVVECCMIAFLVKVSGLQFLQKNA